MLFWHQVVDVLREAMFAYAQLSNGNLACGIMAVTFLARLALLPLTLRMAQAAAVQQEVMRRVGPELEAVRTKWKNEPRRQAEETRRILAREGVTMVPRGCVGVVMQTPVLLALFDAVRQCAAVGGRFLWIGDISKPDRALATLVAAITAVSMAAGPQGEVPAQQRQLLLVIPALFTLAALWHMAAGVGLYWGVSSVVGVAQGALVRRAVQR